MHTNAPLIPNPVGLDKPIQRLQIALVENLPWLDFAFGRATVGRKEGADKRVALHPFVYKGENRYEIVEPHNKWVAHSFIQVVSAEEPVDFQKLQANIYRAKIECVILFDLDKIKAKMGYSYSHRYTEEIKQQIKNVFRKLTQYEITAVHETPEEVFRGYTYDHYMHQTFMHPKGGFKFVLSVSYTETC